MDSNDREQKIEALAEEFEQIRLRQKIDNPAIEPEPEIKKSLQTCAMLIQRMEYWKSLLEKFCDNPTNYRSDQLTDIQKKIEKMFDIGFSVHGRSVASDEEISKAYYDTLETLGAFHSRFDLWKKNTNRTDVATFFSENPDLKILLINEFSAVYDLLDSEFELEANEIKNNNLPGIAMKYVATLYKISEERVRKKVKKIYK